MRERRQYRQTADMNVDVLFACVPVSDFEAALAWYERLFARPPDVVAHEHEVMWHVTDRGWLYIVLEAARAGNSTVSMAVSDIEAATSELAQRGISSGPTERQGAAGRKSVVLDPDGNSIVILEVSHRE
jgi:predicted enzyme related to lactoylglutathione lyase